MTLICRPTGRGNWHVVTIETRWMLDLFGDVRVGHVFQLGARRLRVCEVRP